MKVLLNNQKLDNLVEKWHQRSTEGDKYYKATS